MTITYHHDLIQGTDEWAAARCGLLTASEMENIITPAKLQFSAGEKMRSHLFELAAQRVNNYVEPAYCGYDMLRGEFEETEAKKVYNDNFAPVTNCGFITNDKWGFKLGYSPDGIVGADGLIEIKSRKQKYQFETIVMLQMPTDFLLQVQTGLLVADDRAWCDFLSYSGGMHMFPKRIHPDDKVQAAILEAAGLFHQQLESAIEKYKNIISDPAHRLVMTERKIFDEIQI